MSSDEDDDLVNEFRKRFLDASDGDESDSSDDSDEDFLKPPPIPYDELINSLVEIEQPQGNISYEKLTKNVQKRKKNTGISESEGVKPSKAVEIPVLTPCNVANKLKNLIIKKRCHVCRQYDRKHYKESSHFRQVAKWISEELEKINDPDFEIKWIFCQCCNMPLSGLKEDAHYSEDSHKMNQQNFCSDCLRIIGEGGMAEHRQSSNHLQNATRFVSNDNVESGFNAVKTRDEPVVVGTNENCQLSSATLSDLKMCNLSTAVSDEGCASGGAIPKQKGLSDPPSIIGSSPTDIARESPLCQESLEEDGKTCRFERKLTHEISALKAEQDKFRETLREIGVPPESLKLYIEDGALDQLVDGSDMDFPDDYHFNKVISESYPIIPKKSERGKLFYWMLLFGLMYLFRNIIKTNIIRSTYRVRQSGFEYADIYNMFEYILSPLLSRNYNVFGWDLSGFLKKWVERKF